MSSNNMGNNANNNPTQQRQNNNNKRNKNQSRKNEASNLPKPLTTADNRLNILNGPNQGSMKAGNLKKAPNPPPKQKTFEYTVVGQCPPTRIAAVRAALANPKCIVADDSLQVRKNGNIVLKWQRKHRRNNTVDDPVKRLSQVFGDIKQDGFTQWLAGKGGWVSKPDKGLSAIKGATSVADDLSTKKQIEKTKLPKMSKETVNLDKINIPVMSLTMEKVAATVTNLLKQGGTLDPRKLQLELGFLGEEPAQAVATAYFTLLLGANGSGIPTKIQEELQKLMNQDPQHQRRNQTDRSGDRSSDRGDNCPRDFRGKGDGRDHNYRGNHADQRHLSGVQNLGNRPKQVHKQPPSKPPPKQEKIVITDCPDNIIKSLQAALANPNSILSALVNTELLDAGHGKIELKWQRNSGSPQVSDVLAVFRNVKKKGFVEWLAGETGSALDPKMPKRSYADAFDKLQEIFRMLAPPLIKFQNGQSGALLWTKSTNIIPHIRNCRNLLETLNDNGRMNAVLLATPHFKDNSERKREIMKQVKNLLRNSNRGPDAPVHWAAHAADNAYKYTFVTADMMDEVLGGVIIIMRNLFYFPGATWINGTKFAAAWNRTEGSLPGFGSQEEFKQLLDGEVKHPKYSP